MKSLQYINAQINNLQTEGLRTREKKVKNRIKKQLSFLRKVRNYLESKPTEEFLNKQLLELESKLALINKGYLLWSNWQDNKEKATWSKYNKETGASKIKIQIKTISFILNEPELTH